MANIVRQILEVEQLFGPSLRKNKCGTGTEQLDVYILWWENFVDKLGLFLDDGYTVHQPTITMRTTRKTPPNQQDETEMNTQANQRNKDNE